MSPRIAFVLLKHTLFIRTLRRARPDSIPDRIGLPMALVKTPAFDAGAKRRNEKRAPMSSGLFCRGVPVRHHRYRAERAKHALTCVIETRKRRTGGRG